MVILFQVQTNDNFTKNCPIYQCRCTKYHMRTFSRLYERLKINGRIYSKVRGKTALFFIDGSKQQEK